MQDEKPKDRQSPNRLRRSETVTVRLDPKLRYLAELAALKHRRTLSSFIEWAIEESLRHVKLREGSSYNDDPGTTVADDAAALWDVDDADRFAQLALKYPELLTHEEQKRWKLIRENGLLWRGRYTGPNNQWTWKTDTRDSLLFDRLREHWDVFCAVARGEQPASKLPGWQREKPNNQEGAEGFDDDIPF